MLTLQRRAGLRVGGGQHMSVDVNRLQNRRPLLLTKPRQAPNLVLSHHATGTLLLRLSGTPSRRPRQSSRPKRQPHAGVGEFGYLHDCQLLAFEMAERSGPHLYTAQPDGTALRQVSDGARPAPYAASEALREVLWPPDASTSWRWWTGIYCVGSLLVRFRFLLSS